MSIKFLRPPHLPFSLLNHCYLFSDSLFSCSNAQKISNEENRKCLNALCLIIVYSSNEVLEERNIGRLMGVKGMRRGRRESNGSGLRK